MHRTLRPVGALLGALLLLLGGCTSNSGMKSSEAGEESDEPTYVGPPSRLTLTQLKSGQQFSLVNETHTDPVEYYSQARNSASTKIQTDEIVAALIGFFEDEGFDKYAIDGSAPAAPIGQASQALEIEVAGHRRHMLWGVDRSEKERRCFTTCREGLMEIWNATYAAQAVENSGGDSVFGTSTTTTKKKGR